MALEVSNLSELTAADVLQKQEFISQLVQEDNPNIDVKRGVLHDLLFYYSAILSSATQENIDRLRKSGSLFEISKDASLADTDVVDRVMSNFLLTRREGTVASGTITVVVSALQSFTLPIGGIFEGSGKKFATTAAHSIRTSTVNIQSDNDRALTPLGDGNYSFTVDVAALESGAASMLSKDTTVVPTTVIPNLVRAYVTADFSGGLDTETNDELLLRIQEGLACKALSNRVNMMSLLRNDPSVPGLVASSVIGYGDVEMKRDQHSILPVSFGGRADWYVKTQEQPTVQALTKTATLISTDSANRGTWQFSIARDDVPGFYDVKTIKPAADSTYVGTFNVTLDTRGFDDSATLGELTPDIETSKEGAYSRYQTAVLQFYDSETDTTALTAGVTTQDYSVAIRVMPNVAAVQTLVGSRDSRNYAGDVLIKAAVPCFVSLAFTLQGKMGAILPDPDTVRTALSRFVNNLGFVGRLNASSLFDIIHNYLPDNVACSAIDILGQIRRPDGTIKPLRSSEAIIIPSEPDGMVTARTTAFILNPEDIAISAETVNIPEI